MNPKILHDIKTIAEVMRLLQNAIDKLYKDIEERYNGKDNRNNPNNYGY